jgi:hypothetical protein
MRTLSLATVFSITLVSLAFPIASQAADESKTVCLKPDGSTFSPRCRLHYGVPDGCDCRGQSQVSVAVCGEHESPAPQTAAANHARSAAAARGELMSATFEGRRFCARPPGKSYWGGVNPGYDGGNVTQYIPSSAATGPSQ